MPDLNRVTRAAARGDRQALTSLIRATQGDVWRLCAHLANPAAADELCRETYRRALPRLRELRGGRSVRTWLLAIAYRAWAEDAGARPGSGAPPDRFAAELGTGRMVGPQAEAALPLAALDPADHGAFVLTQLLGCGYAEAAEVSGCTVDAIRSGVARARDVLGTAITAPETEASRAEEDDDRGDTVAAGQSAR